MQKKAFLILFLMLFPYINSYGERISKQSTPFVGAQIFIEPGQTQEQIERGKQYDHLSDPYVRKVYENPKWYIRFYTV